MLKFTDEQREKIKEQLGCYPGVYPVSKRIIRYPGKKPAIKMESMFGQFRNVFEQLSMTGKPVTVERMADELMAKTKSIYGMVKKTDKFHIHDGVIYRIGEVPNLLTKKVLKEIEKEKQDAKDTIDPEFLKNIRTIKNTTQEELADYLFISPKTVGNWEKGRNQVPKEYNLKICRFFGVKLEELVK